jgi:hypothetical protein
MGKRNSVATSNLSQPRKKLEQGWDSDGDEDGDVSIEDDKDKENKDADFLPITDNAMDLVIQGASTRESRCVITNLLWQKLSLTKTKNMLILKQRVLQQRLAGHRVRLITSYM